MHEPRQLCELRPEESPSFETEFDWMRMLAFSGWGVVSLGLWAGIIEAVRLVLR
jgi:hypothetical protein